MMNSALVISPHGLDSEEQNTLLSALQSLETDGIYFELQDNNAHGAHLVVIDDENENGRTFLQQARAGQVKLIFSSQPRRGKNLVSISKPIDMSILKDILSRVFQKMQAQLPGSAEKRKANTPQTTPTDPSINLFVNLLQAKEDSLIIRLDFSQYPSLYINGENKSFATEADNDTLKEMICIPANEVQLKVISADEFRYATEQLVISALYRLLWTSGVYGSHGQILTGHSLQSPVKLRAWPNFTRNDFLPQHLKIAAVLARKPTTLEELCEQTQIDRVAIINFYNAAYATDLIERDAPKNMFDEPPQRTQPSSQKRKSILAKLAARLKLGA